MTSPPQHLNQNKSIKYYNSFEKTRRLRILPIQVPCHHIAEYPLGTSLDSITMARNQAIKVPLINPSHGLIERRPILFGENIPCKPSMPCSWRLGGQQRHDKPRKEISPRFRGLGILLLSGQVEEQIRLNNRARGLMQKHQLARPVAIHILAFKLSIELLRDRPRQLIVLLEYMLEQGVLELRVRLSLFIQTLRRQDHCLWVCVLPRGEIEVVFDIWSRDVFDVSTEGFDCLADFGREADG